MLKIMVSFLLAGGIASANAQGTKAAGPCKQIKNDCQKNGYVVGEAKQGKGMWWDCMCPLIAPNFPEPQKNVLTVPSDSGLVAACRQHPEGQKILENCANMMAKKNAKKASK